MDAALKQWIVQPRPELVTAITAAIREHVAALAEQGTEFYGYALLPGEPGEFTSLVAAYNSESDIKAVKTDEQYKYYRYSVDEWEHYDPDRFDEVNTLLADVNAQFETLHEKDPEADEFEMDEAEEAYANALLKTFLLGFEAAKSAGVFGDTGRFLAIWISDSDSDIMVKSVKRLNSAKVASEFMKEFG